MFILQEKLNKECENNNIKTNDLKNQIESFKLKIEDISNENINTKKIYSEFQDESIREKEQLIIDHKKNIAKLDEKLVLFFIQKPPILYKYNVYSLC